MDKVRADLEWYKSQSLAQGGPPRCPFASVYRCPRYFLSLHALGDAGFTGIEKETATALSARWRATDLWPVVDEQNTMIIHVEGSAKMFWQFCPEVSYDAFGFFASSLNRFADESDAGFMHEYLARIGADAGDPRWAWSSVAPMHYSDCPLYSPLLSGQAMGLPPERNLQPVGGARIVLRSAWRWLVRGSTATAAVLKWAGSVLESLSKLLHLLPW